MFNLKLKVKDEVVTFSRFLLSLSIMSLSYVLIIAPSIYAMSVTIFSKATTGGHVATPWEIYLAMALGWCYLSLAGWLSDKLSDFLHVLFKLSK